MPSLGVLLAGGRGSRLGLGEPKALAVCAGRTLLARALETLETCCDEVVVVAPAGMALPVEATRRVDDPPRGGGPLPALVAGLRARVHTEACVLAVDLPLVRASAVLELRALRVREACVVPRPGGVAQPLAAWYWASATERLGALADGGERSVTHAVEALDPRWVDDDVLASLTGGVGAWLNVNTPEELAAAETKLHGAFL